jgi:hypothetical protein
VIHAIQTATKPGFGLLAAGAGFVVLILVVIVISAVSDWIKKKSQQESTDHFDPTGFSQPKKPAGQSRTEQRPLSAWEEEIRRLLHAEHSPPPVPPPVKRSVPPPVPVYRADPMANETEGRADKPVPTYLSSMERPDSAFARGAHVDERVRARLVDAGDHSDADAAFARVDRIDDRVAARMAAAGAIHPARSVTQSKPPSNAELRSLVKALRTPAYARGAMVASIILGPPKALER